MKNIVSLGLFSFILIMGNAHAGTLRDLSEVKVMKCVREILEERRINQEILLESSSIAKKLQKPDITGLVDECEKLKEKTQSLSRLKRIEVINLIWKTYPLFHPDGKFESNQYNSNHRDFLLAFPYETASCNTYGVSAKASLGLGIGVGVQMGTCVSRSGRRSILVGPTVAYEVGVGVFAFFDSQQELKLYRMNDKYFGLFTSGNVGGENVGIILAGSGGESVAGLGVGVGYTYDIGKLLPLKLIRIGNDFEYTRIYIQRL